MGGGTRYHRVERAYGTFARTFTLPDDDTKVRAEFKDGVLTLHVPKSEKAKPKAIEVKYRDDWAGPPAWQKGDELRWLRKAAGPRVSSPNAA